MCELGISIGLLSVCSYFDLKNKRIPIVLILMIGIISLIDLVIHGLLGTPFKYLLLQICGFIPGSLLFILSLPTKEKIGKGDGILLVVMGLFVGPNSTIAIFCIGLFLQSIVASILLIMKRAEKQTQIPFVPFLMVGNVAVFLYYMFFR